LGASVNAVALFVATGCAYFLLYEWLHLAFHLESSRLVRLPFVRFLAEHHSRHHDTAAMSKWNFNITFPVTDLLLGTRQTS
jgi:sterol desaturase/sphingolipid hydroxylase (fatty acid hydroxylase superfamily)